MQFCPHCSMSLSGGVVVMSDHSIKIRDGEVVIYKRPDSIHWQARYKLSDGKWHRISCKRSNLDDAKRVAADAYDRARFLAKEGIVAVSRRFRDVANLTIKRLEQDIANGSGKVTFHDYIDAINIHLIPYFRSQAVNKIDTTEIRKFEEWRVKTLGKQPSASTVMRHNTALSRVFDTACDEG